MDTLSHYSHPSGAYQGVILDSPPEPYYDSPDWTLPVFEIEEGHPFFVIKRIFSAIYENNVQLAIKCLSSNCNQNYSDIEKLIRSLIVVQKYLAVPEGENVYVLDLWDSGWKNHERRLRFYLTGEGDSWKINRIVRLLPCDLIIDSHGIVRESDEYLFDAESDDSKVDIYNEVRAGSPTDSFVRLIGCARTGEHDQIEASLSKNDRRYSFVILHLFQSIRRVVSIFEFRTHCRGVSDVGSLQFQYCALDLTALNWDGDLFDWQIDLIWNSTKHSWEITGFTQ
jgi:hypothetical protein